MGPDLMVVLGADGLGKAVNPVFERSLGWSSATINSRPWIDFVHPDDRAMSLRAWDRLLRGSPILELENRFRCKDDSYRQLTWTAAPPCKDNADIYACAREMPSSRSSDGLLTAVVEGFPAALLLVNAHGIICVANNQAKKIFGEDSGTLPGRPLEALIHRGTTFAGLWSEATSSPQAWSLMQDPHYGRRPDGTDFPLEIGVTTISHRDERYLLMNLAARSANRGHPELALRRRERNSSRSEDLQLARATARSAVSACLSSGLPFERIAVDLLRDLCHCMEWARGELWWVIPSGQSIRYLQGWHLASHDLERFEAAVRGQDWSPETGLPGRVWSSGKPYWVEDVAQTTACPRMELAAKLGLHGALGVPISGAHGVLAVLLFFSSKVQRPEADTLSMMADLGNQIGKYIEDRHLHKGERQRKIRPTSAVARDPINTRSLEDALLQLIQLEEQTRGRPPFKHLQGKSKAMLEVFELLKQAANSESTILLSGESGTGKELAAHAIHSMSARRDRPFIGINCSALSDTLLESELFGHVRGAFTGAYHHKIGVFEAARGGTLFLDEVGDMSATLQLKLLRVLQEREIQRVGDDRPIGVDVRIITATHRDLTQSMAKGMIRPDFYYRIRVFEIRLPPLRERKEDVPLLVEEMIRDLSRNQGKVVEGVSEEALGLLMEHPWPGNVRELRNAIEYAMVTLQGKRIVASNLPAEVRSPTRVEGILKSTSQDKTERQRQDILEALRRCNDNRTRAARLLGISRVTLWHRMKLLGID